MTQVWSCGGGTQSGAIAALIAQGKLPKPDICFMVDTGRERSSTWPFVDGFIRPMLKRADCELQIVLKADFAYVDMYSGNSLVLPGFSTINGAVGKLEPYCSGEWKREVSKRWLRSIGIDQAVMWIGISLDEMRRVRTQRLQWLKYEYPLLFMVPMRRHQCVEVIRAAGWQGHIPHSACRMCPNLSDAEWIDMKQHWPHDFRSAVEIEREIRLRDPHFYLHPACVPLDQVDFFAQTTMFAERGCTQGCFT